MKNLFKSISFVFLTLVMVFTLVPSVAFAQGRGMCSFPGAGSASGYTQAQCSSAGGTWSGSSASPGSGATCLGEGLGNIMCQVHELLNGVLPVLLALGIVFFVWGVVQYFIADADEAKKKGKDRIIYGIIGLSVIVGVWGLVNIVVVTFGLESSVAPSLAPLTGGDSATCNLEGNPKFQDLMCYLTGIINNSVIPLLFAVATAFFVWGSVKFFLMNSGEEKKRQEGKQFMIWGIIALAVMLSVWGLVAILGDTFGLDTSVLPQVKPSR